MKKFAYSCSVLALTVGFAGLAGTARPAAGAVVFFDDFESNVDGSTPAGWIVSEPSSTSAKITTTPTWSPYNKVVDLADSGNASDQAAIAKDGFDLADFTLEFDVQDYSVDRNGPFTVKLSAADGTVIFSGQINYNGTDTDNSLDYFDTGLHNANEPDQRYTIPHQNFAGSPPYLGVHMKITVNHGAGTYDLTLADTLYADNPLAANVVGKNLAKIEFFGGESSAKNTKVWLDNVRLTAVPEPSALALLCLCPVFMRRRP